MEKINARDYNNSLETKDTLNQVKAVDAAGNDILVTAKTVTANGGCGNFVSDNALAQNKWYRIALSRTGGAMSTALLNVASRYHNRVPCSQLFYIASDGYSDYNTVIELGTADKCIGKIRILSRKSGTGMLDVYVTAYKTNPIDFAYSCNIGFTFQAPVEVPEQPDEGYAVKVFTF